jgi:hypothetical protein
MTAPVLLSADPVENDIINTVTETDLLSYTIPANTLGTTHALRVSISCDYFNNSANRTFILKIKYGSTTMYQDTSDVFAVLSSRRPVIIDFFLFPKNATNSQGVAGNITASFTGLATTGVGDLGSDEVQIQTPFVGVNATEDSTTSLALKVTITHSAADATLSLRKLFSTIEKM